MSIDGNTLFRGLAEKDAKVFVAKYRAQFERWAAEFARRGKAQAIVFDLLPGQPVILDANGEVPWRGAWMTAQPGSYHGEPVMIVEPATDKDREAIEEHVHQLRRRGMFT